MEPEIGQIVKAKVFRLTNFGAFVEITGGERGLIHISQIANGFVKNIADHLKVNEEVEAKVLSKDKNGHFDLSIKAITSPVRPDKHPKQPSPPPNSNPFEDKLSEFLKKSEERLLDLKRNIEAKRSGSGKIKLR